MPRDSFEAKAINPDRLEQLAKLLSQKYPRLFQSYRAVILVGNGAVRTYDTVAQALRIPPLPQFYIPLSLYRHEPLAQGDIPLAEESTLPHRVILYDEDVSTGRTMAHALQTLSSKSLEKILLFAPVGNPKRAWNKLGSGKRLYAKRELPLWGFDDRMYDAPYTLLELIRKNEP